MNVLGYRQCIEGARQRPFFYGHHQKTRRLPVLVACLLITGCTSAEQSRDVRADGGRHAPLPAVTCDRNQLTSWFGTVSGYRKESGKTWLQISTDYDTVEEVTLDHPDQADATAFYRLWGEPFQASDWPAIEATPGVLIPGMRATAWICEDGQTPPLIDWQPSRE